MTDRVLNLGKLIGTLDPLSGDFDAARKEIEKLDDAELADRVAGVAVIDQTAHYEIIFERETDDEPPFVSAPEELPY